MLKLISFSLIVVLSSSIIGLSQNRPTQRYVFVPDKYASVIKHHLMTIFKNGWGEPVPGDLYHCHLVEKANSALTKLATVEHLFEQSAGVLCHSDEQLHRWGTQDDMLPLEQRRPRSLFGFWNGKVIPAASLMSDPTQYFDYVNSGSIHTDELAGELPQLFALRRDIEVLAPDGKPCEVNMIVDVYYSSQRAESIKVNGRGYSLTMDCARK